MWNPVGKSKELIIYTLSLNFKLLIFYVQIDAFETLKNQSSIDIFWILLYVRYYMLDTKATKVTCGPYSQ